MKLNYSVLLDLCLFQPSKLKYLTSTDNNTFRCDVKKRGSCKNYGHRNINSNTYPLTQIYNLELLERSMLFIIVLMKDLR